MGRAHSRTSSLTSGQIIEQQKQMHVDVAKEVTNSANVTEVQQSLECVAGSIPTRASVAYGL